MTIQILLAAALLALGMCDPKHHLGLMSAAALLVAFLSASQDIVIDAWRVEILSTDLQGAGAAMIQAGYRVGMLAAGAGTLVIAQHVGWFAGYATMAALLVACLPVFLFGPEPKVAKNLAGDELRGWRAVRDGFATAVAGPFADFMRRPLWPAILIFIVGYKVGEGMAAVMANPLYISLGFTLSEIAAMSKVVGALGIVVGALMGGVVIARFGIVRSLLLCGVLQALGNLFFVLQVVGGHRVGYLALCVTAENVAGAMAGTALVAYLSSLCSPAFTATQYALLASLASVGRTLVASSSGVLADEVGWIRFFLITTVVTLPALLLLVWIDRRSTSPTVRGLTVPMSTF